MNNVIPFDETKPLRVQPVILGALTTLTLLGTFILDIGTAEEVVTWVPYCLAVVLALQWRGATAIVTVTAAALLLMVIGFILLPPGHLQTETTNRAIGTATLTLLALVCLYIDARRDTHRRALTATTWRLNRLRLFVNSFNTVAVVLTDTRGRVTEWNRAVQRLIGQPLDHMIGQPVYRILLQAESGITRWALLYRTARMKGRATAEVVFSARNASPRRLRVVVKPLWNQVGRLHGYSLVLQV
jgi:PAS domain S-box-containing protein